MVMEAKYKYKRVKIFEKTVDYHLDKYYAFGKNSKLQKILDQGKKYQDYINEHRNKVPITYDIIERNFEQLYKKIPQRILKKMTREGSNFNSRKRVIKYFVHQALYHYCRRIIHSMLMEDSEIVLYDANYPKSPLTMKIIRNNNFIKYTHLKLFSNSNYRNFKKYDIFFSFKCTKYYPHKTTKYKDNSYLNLNQL